jgi:hypothetical protein
VQLAAADPRHADLNHRLAGGRVGLGDVEQLDRSRRREDERLHRAAQVVSMVARLSVYRDPQGRDEGRRDRVVRHYRGFEFA